MGISEKVIEDELTEEEEVVTETQEIEVDMELAQEFAKIKEEYTGDTLIEVKDLKIRFEVMSGEVKAVDGISFELQPGETMGLVGESGCGKTTAAFAINHLLPDNGRIAGGEIWYKGDKIAEKGKKYAGFLSRDKGAKEKREMINKLRWSEISMVFQGAMNALNPVHKVSEQIIEAILEHEDITYEEAKKRTIKLFKLVGLDESRVDGYPHEFSGGMKQRAMIAMALACSPSLIIMDEPTTALDVIMQDKILAEVRDLQKALNIATILITHDISVVAETAEKIAIMYAGKFMEYGEIVSIFYNTANPYTEGLKAGFPNIRGHIDELKAIPGSPPDLVHPPRGCRFHPRCKYAKAVCMEKEPEMVLVEENHWSRCHFAKELYSGELGGD
ncbi:MAG: ABC transporter ATP-binding protein [Thermoplasmata archaeon]